MKIAHIVPSNYLHLIDKSVYHMALAHVVREDHNYAEWYQKHSQKGAYVILDNGVEEEVALELPEILEAADMIHANEIILPDVFRNGPATIESTFKALDDPLVATAREAKIRFAAVVHGKDRGAWLDCFDKFNNDPRIDTIMIPKVVDDIWGYGGRYAACAYIQASNRVMKDKQYHLLGIWSDPIEVFLHAGNHCWIRGLDTALAFQAGYQEVSISYLAREGGLKPKRPQTFFGINTMTAVQSAIVRHNLDVLDKWGGHAKT